MLSQMFGMGLAIEKTHPCHIVLLKICPRSGLVTNTSFDNREIKTHVYRKWQVSSFHLICRLLSVAFTAK